MYVCFQFCFFMISNTFEVTINFLWNGCVNFKRSYLFLKRKHRTLIALWLYGNHVIFLTKNTLNTFNHYIEKTFWFFFRLVLWKKKSIKCILRNCILQPLKFISFHMVFDRIFEKWRIMIAKIYRQNFLQCNRIYRMNTRFPSIEASGMGWDGTGSEDGMWRYGKYFLLSLQGQVRTSRWEH